MVVYGDGKRLLRFFLPDRILVQKSLDFRRLFQFDAALIGSDPALLLHFLFQKLHAEFHALITDIHIPEVCRNELLNLDLARSAKCAEALFFISSRHISLLSVL